MSKKVRSIKTKAIALCMAGVMMISASVSTFAYGDYDDNVEVYNGSAAVAKQIEAEGIVLLENDGTLPIDTKNTKINVFGTGSVDPFMGGGGSGIISSNDPIGFYEALDTAGITYNTELADYYEAWYELNKDEDKYKEIEDPGGVGMLGVSECLAEMPPSELDETVKANAEAYSETAVLLVSRAGNEGSDLKPTSLQLTAIEKQLAEYVCTTYDNVIVLFNVCNVPEMGWVENYDNIKAIAMIWAPGEVGMESVGKMLSGEVNPSGRLADTIAYSVYDHPSTLNFGDYAYTTDGSKPAYNANGNLTNGTGYYYVGYEEGIYVGYRYFETFGVPVQYEFGYGLSYTTFDWNVGDISMTNGVDGVVSATVTVTNTGDRAGKDVVEVYYSAPYYEGGIEKSSIVLGGYAKTKMLRPGQSQTLTVEFNRSDMASYDMENGSYVLDAGTYTIKVARSVKDIVSQKDFSVDAQRITNDRTTGTAITNLFNDAAASNLSSILSRESGKLESTFPTEPSVENGDYKLADNLRAIIDVLPDAETEGTAPVFGAVLPETITLDDVYLDAQEKGIDLYDSDLWDAFLSQITAEEAYQLIGNCGYKTAGLARLGIPATVDNDGPAAIKDENAFSYTSAGIAFPVETVVACTWNDELAEEMGVRIGKDAEVLGTNVWYAPATNTHRSPMGGRNFEYYSEDPLLAGKMSAAATRGAQSQGVVVTLKHFALNDQETHRADNGLLTWADEQSMREIYLKSFEIGVKEGNAKGMMSSFNRIGTVWAGASSALLTDLLREEWGFQGFVVTDFHMWFSGGYMNPSLAVYAQNDAMLSGLWALTGTSIRNQMRNTYNSDPIGFGNAMKACLKNLCYMKTFTQAFKYYEPEDVAKADLDTRLLEYTVSYAEKQDLTNVIASVVEKYNAALAEAKDVLNDALSGLPTVAQEDIDEVTEALVDVIHYLEFKVTDKSELNKLIALAEKYEANKASYIASTYTAFETALAEARNIAADGDLMDAGVVSEAWQKLMDAILGLRLTPDKGKLSDLLATAGSFNLSLYTDDSVMNLQAAINLGTLVLANDDSTEKEVTTAVDTLATAIDDMELLKDDAGSSTENTNTNSTNSSASAASGSNTSNPKTGDNTPFGMMLVLLAISALVVLGSKKRSK